jgi:DNA repair exonuclease SbcCD ATPase subunit
MQKIERLVADRVSKLKAAMKAAEAMVVEEARQVEQLSGSLKAEFAVVQAKLKETDEIVGRKDFSHKKMEETLTAKIKNLQNDIKKKDETLATRENEIDDFKFRLDDNVKQAGELELTNKKTKEEAASHAKRAEDLAESSKGRITALETRLKEQEEFAQRNQSTIKELEQQLAAKVQAFDSLVNDKQELLTRRESEINDLKAQLKRLTKGIGEMSSVFRQAEALTGLAGHDVATAAQNEPMDEVGEEKPAIVKANIAKVTASAPETAGEMVPPEIFQRISRELAQTTNVMDSLSSLIVRRQAKALGEPIDKFPRKRLPELLEALAKEISDEKRQLDFRQRLAQSAQITLN